MDADPSRPDSGAIEVLGRLLTFRADGEADQLSRESAENFVQALSAAGYQLVKQEDVLTEEEAGALCAIPKELAWEMGEFSTVEQAAWAKIHRQANRLSGGQHGE